SGAVHAGRTASRVWRPARPDRISGGRRCARWQGICPHRGPQRHQGRTLGFESRQSRGICGAMSGSVVRLSSEAPERRALEAVRRHAAEGRLPAAAGSLGLHGDECATLLRDVGLTALASMPPGYSESPPYLNDLIALLWSHRSSEEPWTRLMAGTIARTCFGARPLGQDDGVACSAGGSGLLERD